MKKFNEFQTSSLYDEYWKFAAERQAIFYKRNILKQHSPWTKNRILQEYKFTNAYRINDRVSQYLMKNVINEGNLFLINEEDMIFRILLFKIFNKIDTWKALEEKLGEIYYTDGVFRDIEHILRDLSERKIKIYSGAYIMPSGVSYFGNQKKYLNHLALLKLMMNDHLVLNIVRCKSMEEMYKLLLSYPTIGSFLAYQYATDINYSNVTNFSEMDFVMAGPGAKSGIRKCFGDVGETDYNDIIKYVCYHQDNEFNRLGLNFIKLRGRPLQLIDCQNLFCEFDKYSRVAFPNIGEAKGRKRIKQKFKINREKISFVYPEKWHLQETW